MSGLLHKSRVLKVEFTCKLPCDATRDQVLEWIAFELHSAGGCEGDNPLLNYDLEAISEPTIEDSGMHLHERVELVRQEGEKAHLRTYKALRAEPSNDPSADEQSSAIISDLYARRKSNGDRKPEDQSTAECLNQSLPSSPTVEGGE